MVERTHKFLVSLLEELRGLPKETEWAEFKHNKAEPEEIGEYISALANTAALSGKAQGYLVWGLKNGTHELVGTSFRPRESKVGNEELESWLLRKTVPMYPEIAIRELVANAIIHQDFFITGAGPMIEIFDDRVEITNPGAPLVDTDRFLDFPPRSRNETLASFMRRIGICEQRGSGIDKSNSYIASRVIKDAMEANLIKLHNPDASRKYTKYKPFWA